jgi:hypothetical protein
MAGILTLEIVKWGGGSTRRLRIVSVSMRGQGRRHTGIRLWGRRASLFQVSDQRGKWLEPLLRSLNRAAIIWPNRSAHLTLKQSWKSTNKASLSTEAIRLDPNDKRYYIDGRRVHKEQPAKDGGTLEYVFEAGEQNSSNAITKEKVAEVAADFMTTFYHVQVGALETEEFEGSDGDFG